MSNGRNVVVDFVAEGETSDEWKLVLVEEGPWEHSIETELRRVQERLYGCLDAALDGQLAEQFPSTRGKRVVIQLDCYNVPQADVNDFFQKFAVGVFAFDDYKQALLENEFVRGIGFEINFGSAP